MKKNNKLKLNSDEIIKQRIFIIREKKVMIDTDLAKLYGVPTKHINQQTKRNTQRFPADFMFQLTPEERDEVVTNCDHLENLKFSRSLPYAFTEHGVAMLSSVLKSDRAVQMNIFIVRAFIKMRESLENYKDLALKVGEIEAKQNQDHAILKNVNAAVKQLIEKPTKPKRKIGFDLPK